MFEENRLFKYAWREIENEFEKLIIIYIFFFFGIFYIFVVLHAARTCRD